MAGSSSTNPEEAEYPYPSHVCAPNFVTVKLSGRSMYNVWKTQMFCLLESHDMLGFITPEENMGRGKVGLWRRSDALVKGWILGSLSEQVLVSLVNSNIEFTANDLWRELQTVYGPIPEAQAQTQARTQVQEQIQTQEQAQAQAQAQEQIQTQEQAQTQADLDKIVEEELVLEENSISEHAKSNHQEEIEKERNEANQRAKLHQSLYEATQSKSYNKVYTILKKGEVTVTDKITSNGNTALHLMVGTTKNKEILKKMLAIAPQGSTLLNMKNSEGSTLLHVAAIVGNTDAAKMLVVKNKELLYAKDNEDYTPLARALSNMHTETYLYLLNSARDIEKATLFAGSSGDDLLVNIISSKDYNSSCDFLKHYSKFHSDAVLMAIAQNFPRKYNIWGETTDEWDDEGVPEDKFFGVILAISLISSVVVLVLKKPVSRWIIYPCIVGAIYLAIVVMQGIFVEEGAQMHSDATRLLKATCELIKRSIHSSSYRDYYNNAILEATRQNAYEVVVLIVSYFPDAIWSVNEEGHNIIQYAVINRSEKVYNLLYQMSEHKNIYRTIKDPFGNNLLHLAARLAPPDKLSHISGAALQIQRELQWFKEVEIFICPLNIKQKNKHGETPQMVFTREHKELVLEGEKWMKATAESYTITAALITTIMFASAITVPGGNNEDTGIPVFSNDPAFTTFAVSVAISLFTSVTSLLMFLSILTTRFAEQDFLFNLPTKLIIGLTTLFISVTTMIIAFGATLLLVFGQRHSWILIPIIALTCLPITSFVSLQYPLIADLVTSTYGRSIFGKKRDEPFY